VRLQLHLCLLKPLPPASQQAYRQLLSHLLQELCPWAQQLQDRRCNSCALPLKQQLQLCPSGQRVIAQHLYQQQMLLACVLLLRRVLQLMLRLLRRCQSVQHLQGLHCDECACVDRAALLCTPADQLHPVPSPVPLLVVEAAVLQQQLLPAQ
jgi:hypothetical protein